MVDYTFSPNPRRFLQSDLRSVNWINAGHLSADPFGVLFYEGYKEFRQCELSVSGREYESSVRLRRPRKMRLGNDCLRCLEIVSAGTLACLGENNCLLYFFLKAKQKRKRTGSINGS